MSKSLQENNKNMTQDLKNLNVAICGCTINSESYIKKHIENLYELHNIFKSVEIVIYENDSVDNTKSVLNKLQHEKKITLISQNNVSDQLKLRTIILAHARNSLVQYVNNNNTFDYMIMVDMDTILINSITNSIVNAFQNNISEWDVLTGNCKNLYYDIWALRINKKQFTDTHKKIWNDKCIDYDCWDMITHKYQAGIYDKYNHVTIYQKNIPENYPLLEVESAFNGIGIYKTSVIKNCNYVGFTQKCTCSDYNVFGKCRMDTPEHISFHNDIINKNNGKIFICPSLIVEDQPEHTN